MVPDRQKVRTDGRTDGMYGRNVRTDDKTISLRLRRGIKNQGEGSEISTHFSFLQFYKKNATI